MKRLITALVVLGVILAGCRPRTVKVQGKINHLDTGEPIAGAWVYDPTLDTLAAAPADPGTADMLHGMRRNRQVVLSNEEGRYVLQSVSARQHFIYFAAENFEPVKVRFKAKGRDVVAIDVTLEPSPYEINY
jgi:hypothetical protein